MELFWEGSRDDGGSGVFWVYLGGGVGLIVLGTVITAAFAVGARRQLRSIGLLTASGAAPVTVKWFLVAQGALAGLIGSVSGAVLAIVGTRVVPDRYIEDLAGRPVAGPVVRLADLLPIIAIGTVVAAGGVVAAGPLGRAGADPASARRAAAAARACRAGSPCSARRRSAPAAPCSPWRSRGRDVEGSRTARRSGRSSPSPVASPW